MSPEGAQPILFRDDAALVEVRERTATGHLYVAHRFYRESDDGWVQTTPQPALWGHASGRETLYFRFRYGQRDADTVEAVAAGIDDIYLGLRQDLGLPMPDGVQKLSVVITLPETPEIAILRAYFDGGSLSAPSPELLPVLEGATRIDALNEIIYGALVEELFRERQDEFPFDRTWYLLQEGVRMWQLQETANGATQHRQILRWLYVDWPAIHSGERLPHAGEAAWLCAAIAGGSTVIANGLMPDACGGEKPVQLLQELLPPPLLLEDVAMDTPIPSALEHWVRHWQRRAILSSVVGYGVKTYGRASLATLLEATAAHGNWETLIPAVFGVTVEEFEEGWQAYLVRRRS